MGRNLSYRLISVLLLSSWLMSWFAPAGARAALVPGLETPQTMLPQETNATSTLQGTVTSLGYCNLNPAPVEGAEVTLETQDGITSTLTTASGYYQFEFDLDVGVTATITATVNALDHELGQVSGIILGADELVVQDFELVWLVSCTSAEPAALEVTLEAGQTTTLPLRLSNTGAISTTYTITEQPGGFTPFLVPAYPTSQEIVLGDAAWGHSDLAPGMAYTPPAARPNNELIITQSLSQSILSGNSISCNSSGFHTENSYLRVFDLADYNISYDFAISRVEIGVEKAVGMEGVQPAILNIYTIGSDLNWDNMILLNTVYVEVTDTALSILSIPVPTTIPANSILVVEFLTPNGLFSTEDGTLFGNSFFIGSNDQGQTGSSYIIAEACIDDAIDDYPITIENLGFPAMHIVMNVYGDIAIEDPGEVAWLKETPLSGTLDPGGSTDIEVLFTPAYTLTTGTYTSTLLIATDDPNNNPLNIPVTLHVVEYSLELTAQEDYIVTDSGEVVTFTLTLTNTSLGATDRFDLSITDDVFTTTLSTPVTPLLAPGETYTFTVEVEAGWLYQNLVMDRIIVLAQFHTRPIYKAQVYLTTRIRALDIFLPLVFKSP